MRIFLAAVILMVPLTAAANGGKEHGKFTKHKSESFFTVTAEKHFSIEIVLEGNALALGKNRGEIVVHDRHDRDVKGAVITVTPWMPGMDHGVPEIPAIREEEGLFGSRYHFENLVINMGGHWELRVEVQKNDVRDSAVLDFPDVGAAGASGQ